MKLIAENCESLVEDLTADELESAVKILGSIDPLQIKDGKPVYTGDEIDVIGRFKEFIENTDNHEDVVDADENEDEPVAIG